MTAQALRIAYIAPEGLEIPPIQGGSVQIYLSQLLTEMKLNHEASIQPILFCKSSRTEKSLPSQLVRINRLSHSNYVKEVIRKLKTVTVDIIQVDNRPSWIPAIHKIRPTTPIVLNLHSITFLSKTHITRKHLDLMWHLTSAVVVNSQALAATLVKKYGAIKNRIHVIHPGVDLNAFPSRHTSLGSKKRLEFRKKHSCESRFVFLYTGRVIRQKGVHTILQAFRRVYQIHPNTRLYIIGGTHPWEIQYRKHIHRLAAGLPVTIRARIPHKKLADYYLGADAFLCPSQGFEAFGMVNVEALSTGLPVIGSNQGGIAEIVNTHCGKLIKSYRSAKAFQAAMMESIRNQEHWRSTLSRQARTHVETNFTWSETANSFITLYRSLIVS